MESTHAGGEAGTVWIRTPPIRDARGLAAFQQTFAERLSGLQSCLKCGTQCGSCLPILRRLVNAVPQPINLVTT